ncbi:TolC family protein [Methylococcus geothermalis]|uniref:TolC family protein n=1 Tax=Methylococcus geothermalis TaxID=2681310 RepID=UPI001E37AEBD|nr:TolC family protein [Methylococcus geothermalis]
MSEEQVIGLFYARNLSLISAEFGLETAQAQKLIAAAIPNPELNLYSQELAPNYPIASNGPVIYVSVSQLIETAGKRRLRMENSLLGEQAAESDLRDAIRTLTQAVRRAYYDLLLAQETMEATQEQSRHVQRLVEVQQKRFDVGDISERDLTRIKIEALKSQSDIDKTTAQVVSARSQLAVFLAWPEETAHLSVKDQWPDGKAFDDLKDAVSAVGFAMERRPDLLAARTRYAQAKQGIDLAKAQRIPDVRITAGFAHDLGNFVQNGATLGISVPLPLFYRQEGEIAQAGIRSNDAELRVRQTEVAVHSEVSTAFAAWISANTIVKRFETEVLQKAKHIRDSAEIAYTNGSTDIIDLIQAQRDYRNTILDYYQAQANRAYAYADLKMAIGEE